ncbi:hypothetical protein LAZ67_1004219 [Cordylochernes scorpioides]|uniref:Reverse transcriptase domain-containing protein n=1 Tax=Cordylochernes scorpioides TaxID=51811 RepID=A0ABY6JXN5_9ARAC|nr:hypothetical protein LAZ67_1004219 [Cordylochernes scorpioides]
MVQAMIIMAMIIMAMIIMAMIIMSNPTSGLWKCSSANPDSTLQGSRGHPRSDHVLPRIFTLASINVRVLAARERSIELCHFLRQHGVDVAFVQETNASSMGDCARSLPRNERHQQLKINAVAAVQDDAWVLGDLNINEECTNDTVFSSVKALSELKDQTAHVDIATFFGAVNIPTRVASYGSRVDASRLDRGPSRFPDRIAKYTGGYYISPAGRVSFTSPTLRGRHATLGAHCRTSGTIIETTSSAIIDMIEEDLWSSWSSIKAELLAEAVPAGQAASTEADYPSLPNLGRALRVCRPARTNIRDEEGNIIEGTELQYRVYSTLQLRFASQSCESNAATEFIRGTTTPLILEEDDPLLRPAIFATEIDTAIRRSEGPPDEMTCPASSTWLSRTSSSTLSSAFTWLPNSAGLCLHRRGTAPSAWSPNITAALGSTATGLSRSPRRTTGFWATSSSGVCSPILLFWYLSARHTPFPVGPLLGTRRACATRSTLAVISTDLESAFDTLDRGFLVSPMVSLRLPQVFIGWFLLLYAGADATVRAGGLHTKPFQLLNGVRQGCAISAAMFSLATSPLLRRLEQALGPGNVLAYADDIVLLIHSEDQFSVADSDNFRIASGIKGNSPRAKVYGGPPTPAASLSVVHHIHGYLPTDRTTHKIQARLARFIWGPERTAWFPGSVLARPVSLGGFGLIDIETQLRLSCFKGVQTALRGSRNAYSWLAVADIFTLDHSVLTPHQLLNLPIIGGCRLLAPTRWVNACIGDFAGPAPPLTRPTRCALADAASLISFCRRLNDENLCGTYRVNTIAEVVVLLGVSEQPAAEEGQGEGWRGDGEAVGAPGEKRASTRLKREPRKYQAQRQTPNRGGSSKSPTVQDETLANLSTSPDVLLPTLRVTLKGNRTEKTARAIIDTGSQRSYILHSTAMEMEYEQSRREFFRHSLFGGSSTDVVEHEVYTIHLSDINNSYRCEFEALGQPLICGSIPPVCPRSFLEGSEELDVSDLMRDRIEVLIGADIAGRLLTDDQRRISSGLVAIRTKLGWTVMGKIPPTEVRDDTSSLCLTTLLSLDLENLWKLDAIGVSDAEVEKKTQSLQAEMEEHFAHTTTRDIEGRYEVALPWVQDKERIPSNKDLAENQLSSVRRKLEEVGDMNEYGQIFEEWMKQGIIDFQNVEETEKFGKQSTELLSTACFNLRDWDSYVEKTTLHIFCDASQFAYATCIFLRIEKEDRVDIQLIQARTRVAPLKKLTIPRLELLACLIGARLTANVIQDLEFEEIPRFYWTDSTNALCWIQREDNWAAFVMNRVKEIHNLSPPESWRHIPGRLNPADLPSRGCSAESLKETRWWEGPAWLKVSQEEWPKSTIIPDLEIVYSERRKTILNTFYGRPIKRPNRLDLLNFSFPCLSRRDANSKVGEMLEKKTSEAANGRPAEAATGMQRQK